MKNLRMILFIIIVLGCLLSLTFFMGVRVDKQANATIDFGKSTGKISINYGANEDDNWFGFVDYPETRGFHEDVNSQYIRVWVSSQSYRESTIPLLLDGSYDFTSLDSFINAVLEIGAIPYMIFAHAPGTFDEGHAQPPPANDTWFADYVETVVKHYKETCENNQLAKQCDVNEWYFEIWNEPSTNIWWEGTPPRYAKLFNTVYPRIKALAPDANVGGYTLVFFKSKNNERLRKFLQYSDMDFVSVHHFGNAINGDNDKEKMMEAKELFYDSILDLRAFIERYKPNKAIKIINSEYSSDSRAEYMPYLDEPFTATWYASALTWEIKTQDIFLEMFYAGTSNFPDKGFGMWSINNDDSFRMWPVYYMKKSFVKYNQYGSSIFDTAYNSDEIDILAVQNNQGRFITLINKLDKKNTIALTLQNTQARELMDLNNQERYHVSENIVQITLEPYEVKFLQVT